MTTIVKRVKIYKIGVTILGNDGKYKGRLTQDGSVVDVFGKNIGHIKNNGSFIDLDKNFVEIIKKWYEENNIDTCENYGDVNDEITFESKIKDSPLKTPKSYKKTRRTRRLLDSP